MSENSPFKQDLFAGHVVAITGGGSGINLGIAKVFASLGASIAICGRTQSRLDEAAAQLRDLGARTFAQVADVRDPAAVEAFLTGSEASLGPVDVMVCGAAGNFLVPAEKLSPNGFRTVVDIDLMGSFHAARAAHAQLVKTRGLILFLSAAQSYMPHAYQVHAAAAKAGIDAMMRNLALEWGRFGIRVNSIAPGPIEGTEGLSRLSDPNQREALVQSIPLKRLGQMQDVGQLAAFLASPAGSFVSGAMISCDGGQALAGSAPMNATISRLLASPL